VTQCSSDQLRVVPGQVIQGPERLACSSGARVHEVSQGFHRGFGCPNLVWHARVDREREEFPLYQYFEPLVDFIVFIHVAANYIGEILYVFTRPFPTAPSFGMANSTSVCCSIFLYEHLPW
jgi:hypothetical protein